MVASNAAGNNSQGLEADELRRMELEIIEGPLPDVDPSDEAALIAADSDLRAARELPQNECLGPPCSPEALCRPCQRWRRWLALLFHRKKYGKVRHASDARRDDAAPAPWGAPLLPEAYHGPAGELARLFEPASEAHPAALLFQALVCFGGMAGRARYFIVEGDRHHVNENVVLVGRTSKGRKGTSFGRVNSVMSQADMEWAADRVQTGLSSGEGLIWAVRDPIHARHPVKEGGRITGYEEVEADPGVRDKRLLVYEPEFANVLKQTERQGNTLSPLLRHAWDGRDLRSMTKNSPARATGAHVSLIGHITDQELRRYLTATESANGFANRFLFVCVKRARLLPFGGHVDEKRVADLVDEFTAALAFAQTPGEVKLDGGARSLWRAAYTVLSDEPPGLTGALMGRAEAHALRLAMTYALLDQSDAIGEAHLLAGLASWEYADRSVRYVFGEALGDPLADEILDMLRAAPGGMSRNDLVNAFGRHQSGLRLTKALTLLAQKKLARSEDRHTGGRPAQYWHALPKGQSLSSLSSLISQWQKQSDARLRNGRAADPEGRSPSGDCEISEISRGSWDLSASGGCEESEISEESPPHAETRKDV
jgi:hypothetical protein